MTARLALAPLLLPLAALTFGASACPTPLEDDDDDLPDSGVVEPVSCVDDSECGDGAFCLGGLCSTAECETKATCPASEVCNDGVCGPPPATCTSSEDCPGSLVCDGFTNTCFNLNGEGEGEGEGGEGEGEGGAAIDLSGFVLENRENDPVSQASVLPDGTELSPGETLVIGRNASRNDFEGFWGSIGGASYLSSGAETTGVPIVNGDEQWALVDGNTLVDGETIPGDRGNCYQRISDGPASNQNNWAEVGEAEASPGTSELPQSGVGLVISEWCDASGNGNFDFEFIELYYAP